LSSRTRPNRFLPITASVVGIATAFALAVAAFTWWPPSRAVAATTDARLINAVLLGVDGSTAVAIGPEVPIGDKFEATTATMTASANAQLVAPAAKKASKVVAKQAKPADKKAKTHKKRARKSTKKTATNKATKGGWKKARVSWYGPGFYGHGMAGGGKLKRNSMVLAHRSLPFGTKVQVKYKGRTVIATVKDRGPFIRGRVFDLGPGTAKALHFSGVGTIKYKIIR
jgi:rare lipoprotein A (peptidoglycan hydrolase)